MVFDKDASLSHNTTTYQEEKWTLICPHMVKPTPHIQACQHMLIDPPENGINYNVAAELMTQYDI